MLGIASEGLSTITLRINGVGRERVTILIIERRISGLMYNSSVNSCEITCNKNTLAALFITDY